MSVATTSEPPPAGAVDVLPRWHDHAYNRAGLYRLAAGLAWLPRPARLGLARQIGRLAPRLLPVERAAARRTLARVTGAADGDLDRLTRAVFANFAMCFADLVSTNRRPAAELMGYVGSVRGGEWLDGFAGPAISLTAHVGNWELAGRLLARRSSREIHVVVADNEPAPLARWVRRGGDGVRFVPRARPTTALRLITALRRGDLVALQGDRALGSRGDVMAPFFGHPAPFPVGPFVLARASRVPLVAAFCVLRADRRYDVIVLPPMTVVPGEEEDALRRWVAGLEDVVRERPTQWFNFFDVWSPARA